MAKHQAELTSDKFLYETVGWSVATSILLRDLAVDNSIMSLAVDLQDGRCLEFDLAKVRFAGKLKGTRRVFSGDYSYDYRLRAVQCTQADGVKLDEIAGIGICENPRRIILLDEGGHRVAGTKMFYDITSVSVLKGAHVNAAA